MKKTKKYSVFISYRRNSASILAEMLRQMLLRHGISEREIFMDTHTMASGDVKSQLAEAVKLSNNFILLITDGCCQKPHDAEEDLWLFEIEKAREENLNIIPIFWNEKKEFPSDLSFLSSHNSVSYIHEYSEAFEIKLFGYLKLSSFAKIQLLFLRHKKDVYCILVILLLLIPYFLTKMPAILMYDVKNAIFERERVKEESLKSKPQAELPYSSKFTQD